VTSRHESLRTSFATSGDEPCQRIAERVRVDLPLIELPLRAGEDVAAAVRRCAAVEAQQVFDLGRGPLLAARLVRLAAEKLVLFVTMHHIISDGWAMAVMFAELMTLYGSFRAGEPSPLAELPLQYVDYAAWQRSDRFAGRLERQRSYWREKLAGAPDLHEMPTDRPRPPQSSYRGATYAFMIPAAVMTDLAAVARARTSGSSPGGAANSSS